MADEEAAKTGRTRSSDANGVPTPAPARRRRPAAPPAGPAVTAPEPSAANEPPTIEPSAVVEDATMVNPPGDAPRAPTAGSRRAAEGTESGAEHADVRMGAVSRIEASDVSVSLGAVGAARADRLTVDKGTVGAAMAGSLDLSRGYARSILARQVQIDRGAARVIVAADVRAHRTAVIFLVAGRVSGDVRVLFDWRGAIAFGAVAGVVAGVISRLRRRG